MAEPGGTVAQQTSSQGQNNSWVPITASVNAPIDLGGHSTSSIGPTTIGPKNIFAPPVDYSKTMNRALLLGGLYLAFRLFGRKV